MLKDIFSKTIIISENLKKIQLFKKEMIFFSFNCFETKNLR